MGQPVLVSRSNSRDAKVVRFEANRNLTGMGHERFSSLEQAGGTRPSAVLASRMLATGKVASVHIFGNLITVELNDQDADGLDEIIRDLYQYWKPGMEPPAFEDMVAEEEAVVPVASGDLGAAALSAAAQRVPAHLLERSQAARARSVTNGD